MLIWKLIPGPGIFADAGAGDNDNLMLLPPELFAVRALEGLTAVGEEWDLLWELRKGNSKSVWSAEWSELDSLLHFRGKVYVPPDPELRRRIVFQHHDTRIAGHVGRWKTLELVSQNYW